MRNTIYNLILAVLILLIVGLLLILGLYAWQQYGPAQISAKQVASGNIQQVEKSAVQPVQPLTQTDPLTVLVNGRRYPIDIISARDNGVTISTKKELGKFADLEIKISFSNQNIESFSNKNLYFTGKDFSEPSIQVSWMAADSKFPKTEFISKNYDLQMQFGQEQDYRIPVQLKLVTNEKVSINAAGKFIAKTSDLVVVNGEVDLHQDNSDTVMYVIEQFIKRIDKVAELKSLKHRSHSMSMPGKDTKKDPNPGRVYSSASVMLDFETIQGKEEAEFQMVRTNSGWQVYRVLKPQRLQDSVEIDLSVDALFMFGYFGEQVIEQTFTKDKVKEWEKKGAMLSHRHPDPAKQQTQMGSASYLVKLKDDTQRYVKISAIKDGVWKIDRVFDGSKVPQAHAKKPAKPRGSDLQKYMAARRLEQQLNRQYADLQARSFNFSCGYSNLLTQCRISWRRLDNGEEKCEGTKYMYKRNDKKSAWEFVRELAADEELDHRDGLVKKKDKPRKYHCW